MAYREETFAYRFFELTEEETVRFREGFGGGTVRPSRRKSSFFTCVVDIDSPKDCPNIERFVLSLGRPSPQAVFASLATDSQSEIISLPEHVRMLACATGADVDFSFTVLSEDDN